MDPAPWVQDPLRETLRRLTLSVCPWEMLTRTMSGRRSEKRNRGMALRVGWLCIRLLFPIPLHGILPVALPEVRYSIGHIESDVVLQVG